MIIQNFMLIFLSVAVGDLWAVLIAEASTVDAEPCSARSLLRPVQDNQRLLTLLQRGQRVKPAADVLPFSMVLVSMKKQ